MRRLHRLGACWGLGAALLLGGTAAATAGPDDSGDASARTSASAPWSGGHLFGGLTSSGGKAGPEKLPPNLVMPPHPLPRDEAAAIRAREEDALLRRMAVCDKLRQIAARTGDDELDRMAEQLLERANNVYLRRIADLPASHASLDVDRLHTDRPTQRSEVESLPSSPLPHTVPGVDGASPRPNEEKP
jgi:hypothetical protein